VLIERHCDRAVGWYCLSAEPTSIILLLLTVSPDEMEMATNTMNKAEFQRSIKQQLKDDGVLDELQTSIKSKILSSLLSDNKNDANNATKKDDPKEIALLSLLFHFLESRDYPHTLSVYVAESKLNQPLSVVDAFTELGLQDILSVFSSSKDNNETNDILSLLQSLATWLSSQTTSAACAIRVSTANVQTDDNKENTVNQSHSPTRKSSILEIEREIEQRLRNEFNDKLKLSAKRQAIEATRRVEQKHKQSLQQLKDQVDAEKAKARRREEELELQLSQQQVHAQGELKGATTKFESALLEKESLHNEIELLAERVKTMQLSKMAEWEEQHDHIQEKTRITMEELANQRHSLQLQMNEVADQRDQMKAKEREFASLNREIETLRTQYHEDTTKNHTQLSELQSQYESTKSELEASRLEVSGLRSLLRTSQAAIESISFREIAQPANSESMHLDSVYDRSPANADIQLLGSSPTNNLAARSMIVPENRLQQSEITHQRCKTTYDEGVQTCEIKPTVNQPELRHDSEISKTSNNTTLPKHEEKMITSPVAASSNNDKKLCLQPVIPEDPPCSSLEDPPESETTSEQVAVTILNLSALTEDVDEATTALLPNREDNRSEKSAVKDDMLAADIDIGENKKSTSSVEEKSVNDKSLQDKAEVENEDTLVANEDRAPDKNNSNTGTDVEVKAGEVKEEVNDTDEDMIELLPSANSTVYIRQKESVESETKDTDKNDTEEVEQQTTSGVDSEQYSEQYSEFLSQSSTNQHKSVKDDVHSAEQVKQQITASKSSSEAGSSASSSTESSDDDDDDDVYSESFCS